MKLKKVSIIVSMFLLFGCTSEEISYQEITPQEAMEMMNSEVMILDVRTVEEYEEGHIEGSMNVPLDELASIKTEIEDVDQTILVYCRSGKRSKSASEELSSLGYVNVYDFGGILDWPYELVK